VKGWVAMDRIGILVDRRVLARAMRGRPTIERVGLYRSVALELGVDIVVFCVERVDVKRAAVVGYAPAGEGWRRVRVPLPKVVHKRVLYRKSAPLRKLRRMQRRGVVFVNPVKIQDKARMLSLLRREPSVAAHIPPTRPYSWPALRGLLGRGGSAVVKPKIGSLGQGIVRVVPLGTGAVEWTRRRPVVIGRRSLKRRLARLTRRRRYLLQDYVALARYEGRPFDLRVPVQRGPDGGWLVPGMVAKVAGTHPYLTNMAQGGRAVPGAVALRAAFGPQADEVARSAEALALETARALARRHPFAADLGLDIGIDRSGKPWLFEVNTRDQRYTFYNAGMHDTFRALYRNPVAFCARLSRELAGGRR